MKSSTRIIPGFFILLFIFLPAAAQEVGVVTHFAKDGLAFDYPATMKLEDLSTANGQHLVMLAGATGAQIMIVSRFDKITSPEQLAEAKHSVMDVFVDKIEQELRKLDPKLIRGLAETRVAGSQASGVRMKASLNSEPGSAEIYSILLGQRLVMVTLIGSEKEISAAEKEWAMVRNSLKVGTASSP